MSVIAALPAPLLVALGGGTGAVLRWWLGGLVNANVGPGFPWGTWLINLVGSLLLGLLAGALSRVEDGGEPLRLLLGVGLLGGFTTFSTFSVEMVAMVNRGEAGMALAYAVSSVAGGVVLALAGLMLGRG
jgi:CrcB protein